MILENGQWWYDPPPNPKCSCGHDKKHHAYVSIIGDNVGRCLLQKYRCECTHFREKD